LEYFDAEITDLPHLGAYIAIFEYFRFFKIFSNLIKYRVFNLESQSCNCHFYLSHSYCKHQIAVKVKLNQIDTPGKKSLINIYQSKPVGRPREVGNALNID